MKYFVINVAKEVKTFVQKTKNYRRKNLDKTKEMERHSMFMNRKTESTLLRFGTQKVT